MLSAHFGDIPVLQFFNEILVWPIRDCTDSYGFKALAPKPCDSFYWVLASEIALQVSSVAHNSEGMERGSLLKCLSSGTDDD